MPVYRAFLRTMGALAFVALALACGGKKNSQASAPSTKVQISGKVTYTRVPLAKDANGVPTGLMDETVAANLVTLPARGVRIRIYQQVEQTQPDGTKTYVWVIGGGGLTDSVGNYFLSITKDRPTMVELISTFDGGGGQRVNLIGEPGGIQSLEPATVMNRRMFAIRKAADGQAPANVNAPTSIITADATVDFAVGLKDSWWLVDPDFNQVSGEVPASIVTGAVLETDLPGRTAGEGAGSRPLGIGDTLAAHLIQYGIATPGSTTLDLHYWPGRSEPRGTYIEYDLSSALYAPGQNYEHGKEQFHVFGSIRGAADNDDAWDEGVLLPLFARNALYTIAQGRTFASYTDPLYPIGLSLTNLSPNLALREGMADAMAAALLKSPYLADTNGTALAHLTDIRDLTGLTASDLSVYSARSVRALAWEIILKANSIASPGTATDWATIKAFNTARFVQAPGAASGATGDLEPLSIYSQIKRLQETKTAAEPVDLASIFTDAALTPLLAPFGLTWPRPTTGPESLFAADWGTDPDSATKAIPPVPFSMATAVQVNGAYPNLSQGEIAYAGFSVSTDKRYVISATITPALGAGAAVELDVPRAYRTFLFTGSGGSTDPVIMPMSGTAPYFHPVQMRLKSPTTLQPDFMVTVVFTPAP
ncbi:MAG TPA: hypothetical protein VJ486_01255 [Geothrix sp.]|nr:hypothetical protein [Geothrix sp.]